MSTKATDATEAVEVRAPWVNPTVPTGETLAGMVAGASSHHNWSRVVVALTHEIEAAREDLRAFESGNEAAALTGAGAFDEHSRKVVTATERVKQLVLTLATAREREDAAQTAEMNAKMIDDAKAGVAMLPELKALWRAVFDEMMETLPGKIAALEAKLKVFDDLQARGVRRLGNNPTDPVKEFVVPHARIRGLAAAECPRPVLGADSSRTYETRDSIYLAGRLAVELLLNKVVWENAHDARRNASLVGLNPHISSPAAAVVRPTMMRGRIGDDLGMGDAA